MNYNFFLTSLILIANNSFNAAPVPFDVLKRILPANPIILEAGGHIGEDTVWMSEMWPDGQVHSFEPLPISMEKLKSAVSNCNNVKLYQLALSSKKGTMPFYVADGASSLNRPTDIINQNHFHADLEHPTYVEVTTLDTWAKENNISRIDFMWLDLEGNELEALKGGLEILKTVKLIYTEVNLQPLWHNIPLYPDVKKWFEEQGFVEIWSDFMPGWNGNVLFYNKNAK